MSLFFLMFYGLVSLVQAGPSAKEVYDLASQRLSIDEGAAAQVTSAYKGALARSAWENPQVQYGEGSARVGQFRGRYREWMVTQAIPINGVKGLLSDQAELVKVDAQLKAAATKKNLSAEIISGIFTYLYNKELSDHLKERIHRLELIETSLKRRKAASPKDQVEREIVATKLLNLKKEILDVESGLNMSLAFFRKLTANDALTEVNAQWPDDKKLSQLVERLKQSGFHNAQVIENSKKWTESERKISQRQRIPDLKLYYLENYQDQVGQEPNVNSAVGVNITVPLFNVNRSAVAEKRAELQTKEVQLRQSQVSDEVRLVKLLNQYSVAQWTMNQFSKVNYEHKAEKELQRHTNSFKLGLIPMTNYMDYDDQIHMSLHAISRAKLDMIETILELYKIKDISLDLKGELL